MTKKDYVVIASALRAANATAVNVPTESTVYGVSVAIQALAVALKANNPKFDTARFLMAASAK